MLEINKHDYSDLRDFLKGAGKEAPKATAMTLTWMGQAAKQKLEQKIPSLFDRPTPWTVKSTYLKAATIASQQAEVYIKDGSISSLAHHIEGGQRPVKMFERRLRQAGILRGSNQYVVPAKRLKLNQYGNASRGLINKVLSSVGAQMDSAANTTSKALSRNSAQGNYFISPRQGGLPPGIFKLKGRGANRTLQPVFLFVKKTTYKKGRYPFFEIADDAAFDAMPEAASRAMDRILNR